VGSGPYPTHEEGPDHPIQPMRWSRDCIRPLRRVRTLTDPRAGVLTLTDPQGGILTLSGPPGGVLILSNPRGGVITLLDSQGGVLTLSNPRGRVLTLTNPRGGQYFLKTGRRGPCRPADRTDVVCTHAGKSLLYNNTPLLTQLLSCYPECQEFPCADELSRSQWTNSYASLHRRSPGFGSGSRTDYREGGTPSPAIVPSTDRRLQTETKLEQFS